MINQQEKVLSHKRSESGRFKAYFVRSIARLFAAALVGVCVLFSAEIHPQNGALSFGPSLVDPPICSVIGQSSAPNCNVLPPSSAGSPFNIQLGLTAGLQTVSAAGYKFQSPVYNGSFVTPVIELLPGSTLNVHLTNTLPPSESAGVPAPGMEHSIGHTNLHTHGLIVSPQNATSASGHGDNILVDIGQNQSFNYHIQIPASLPAGVLDSDHAIAHPDGLYWYHPHLHGLSKNQVAGGMSGVLSVGRGKDLLTVNGPGGAPNLLATAALRSHTDVHYLELKDFEIATSTQPEAANGNSPAQWNNDADPQYCGTLSLATMQAKNGYCSGTPGSGPHGSNPVWLFTINGQRYPTINIGPGRNHLWRIANLSPTATYILELADGIRPVEFQVVSVDGVVAGVRDATPGSVAAVCRKQLLMMPAGRADIFIANTNNSAAPKHLVLRTAGYDTGGDTWPKVNLASVRLAPSPSAASVSLRVELPTKAMELPLSTEHATAFIPKLSCIRASSGLGLKPGEHRRITLDQTDTDFRIGSQIVDQNGTVDPASVIAPQPFPHMLDWDTTKHLCIPFQAAEIWEIRNVTPEDHNFHLHQSKFRLATSTELASVGIHEPAVVDPTGNLSPVLVDAGAADDKRATIWHDTLPAPRAGDATHPGKLYIAVNFKAPEQIGRFVVHCHILEHEDNGMMAPIEVIQTH